MTEGLCRYAVLPVSCGVGINKEKTLLSEIQPQKNYYSLLYSSNILSVYKNFISSVFAVE